MIVVNEPDGPVPATAVRKNEGLVSVVWGNLPFQQMTFFAFEPPLFFLHQARRFIVEYDILEETLDLRD
jgi:hypothetical protein